MNDNQPALELPGLLPFVEGDQFTSDGLFSATGPVALSIEDFPIEGENNE